MTQPDMMTGGRNDVVDVNWHSQSVQSSDSNSLTVQNLSQDTTYEFYVRAKNIIGEGPRSEVVQATTKRVILGSVTPINPLSGSMETMAASTVAGITGGKFPLRVSLWSPISIRRRSILDQASACPSPLQRTPKGALLAL